MASCAIPGIYPPVTLTAKNARGECQPYLPARRWVDGSVSEDLPAKRLARLYGVNHYIASQTNPLVLMFISDPKLDHSLTASILRMSTRTLKESARVISDYSKRSLAYWPRFNLLMNMYASVVSQNYTADINIFPGYRLFDPTKLLVHLSEKELMDIIQEGEHACWPKVEMIRICSKISKTLDRLLDRLDSQSVHKLAQQHHKKMARKTIEFEESLES
jgi:TAG lipase/steryl ester hydrolase/phospholipase A2/LPA acyltransferase